jgi:hypothetical protein
MGAALFLKAERRRGVFVAAEEEERRGVVWRNTCRTILAAAVLRICCIYCFTREQKLVMGCGERRRGKLKN